MTARFRNAWPVVLGLLLGGCHSGDNLSDLQRFVADGPKTVGKIEPLPALPKFEPTPYQGGQGRDPFTSFAELRLRQLAAAASRGPRPDSNRLRQPLEKYDLSSLTLIGIVRDGKGQLWGVIQAPDQKVFRATIGSYVGTHDGRIVAIDDQPGKRYVRIEELIPNAFGGYEKQESTMQMKSS